MSDRDSLVKALVEGDDYLIATHINPDGDALGSALALAEALRLKGKRVIVYDRDPVPEIYGFMPGIEELTDSIPEGCFKMTAILLDCNNPSRAAIEACAFEKAYVIDHHETESSFGDIRWVEPWRAATGLMVLDIIDALGVDLTTGMAMNIYTAIAVDTGTFRYDNSSAEVFRSAGRLVEAGAKPQVVSQQLYETWTEGRLRLLAETLSTLEMHGDVAIISVTREMLERTGGLPEDTENFSNYPRMIMGVAMSAMFRELKNGGFKASLRSRGMVNVAEVAETFGGGGHKNAAGFTADAPLQEAKRALLLAVAKWRDANPC